MSKQLKSVPIFIHSKKANAKPKDKDSSSDEDIKDPTPTPLRKSSWKDVSKKKEPRKGVKVLEVSKPPEESSESDEESDSSEEEEEEKVYKFGEIRPFVPNNPVAKLLFSSLE